MQSLLTRRDVLVVASVSCIYGLGDPEEYGQNSVSLRVGETYKRDKILRRLTDIYYERNDYDLSAGKFRVRGDTLEVHPSSQEIVVRISFWGDEVERITEVDPLTGEVLADRASVEIYPARYFVTSRAEARSRAARHRRRDGRAGQAVRAAGQAARSAAAAPADPVRPRDAVRDGLLLGRRELLAAPVAARGGQHAVDVDRLLPGRLRRASSTSRT